MQTTVGSSKNAERLAAHLGERIDGACIILPPGSVNAQIGGTVGPLLGAVIGVKREPAAESSTIDLVRSWLGLGPDGLVVTGSEGLLVGRPKGDAIVRSSYADARTEITKLKFTLRAFVTLADGETLTFEVKRIGPANKPSVEVVELLATRCGGR